MENKYGNWNEYQWGSFKKKLHSDIHWLLLYYERKELDNLQNQFVRVQRKLSTLSELAPKATHIVDAQILIETAKLEQEKENPDFSLYRKSILDAHQLIDLIIDKES